MILTVTLNPTIDKFYYLDRFKLNGLNRSVRCDTVASGKGLNVSRTLKSLGGETFATGIIAGYTGEFIINEINGLGIPNEFVRVPGETRVTANIMEIGSPETTEVLENGFAVTEADTERFLAVFGKRLNAMNESDFVVISGSACVGCPDDIYNVLIGTAKDRGIRTVLDTSGERLKRGVSAEPFMIKPNLNELRYLTGINIPAEKPDAQCAPLRIVKEAAAGLVRGGTEYVCVTMGADGAVVACRDGVYREPAERITPKRTVGCGDAFTAGFVKGLYDIMKPQECLKYAIKTATEHAIK